MPDKVIVMHVSSLLQIERILVSCSKFKISSAQHFSEPQIARSWDLCLSFEEGSSISLPSKAGKSDWTMQVDSRALPLV